VEVKDGVGVGELEVGWDGGEGESGVEVGRQR